MRVLVIGYNAFDILVPVAGMPEPDCKVDVPAIRLGGGGPGATAAVALARLGAEVRLVTPLTTDLPGQRQKEELLAAGVDISRCPRIEGRASAMAVILVDAGTQERTIFWSRGDLPELDPAEIDPDWMQGMDLLYCDGHDNAAAIRLAEAARGSGRPVVLDAGSVRRDTDALVGLCTDVVSSSVFAEQLTGLSDPVKALGRLREQGPGRVGITFGREGSIALLGDEPRLIPAFEVEVLDTTGAGDVFHAGYAFALAQGRDQMACMEYGSAVAALKCRGWGGRSTLPTAAEVESFLASAPRLSLEALRERLKSG